MQPASATTSFAILERFGGLLIYPGKGYIAEVEACMNAVAEIDQEAAQSLNDFTVQASGLTVEQLQELYVQTFDLNPVCALEVGWQLYGDNYDRGNFLVKMRQELERYGVPENNELPDHLCHVLPLLGRMEASEVGSFSRANMVPALNKMLAAFERKNSPYENVLKALSRILELMAGDTAREAKYA